ncbi:MAG: poly-gamma-glutamate biosynthesis protein PgsC/CapC [Bacteroidota bacterium]
MILELSLIGIFVSGIYILIFNVFPGGIIVPVYISLYLTQPKRLFSTLLIALLATIIFKYFSKKMILFGRRRFVFLIVLSTFLSLFINNLLNDYYIGFSAYQSIGLLIPGLLANNMIKQGVLITFVSLFTVSIIIFFIFKAFFYL